MDKLDGEPFSEQFQHPYYPQHSEPFEEDLSILDVLFNIGADKAKILLTTKQDNNAIDDGMRKLE